MEPTLNALQLGVHFPNSREDIAFSFIAFSPSGNSSLKKKSLSFQFAEWCLDYGAHGCRIPDRPYSLFEGKSEKNAMV